MDMNYKKENEWLILQKVYDKSIIIENSENPDTVKNNHKNEQY